MAYDPNSPAQVLQPELTAAQKASERLLRSRSSRIASMPRFDEADPRARRRRQLALDAAVGRHLQPGGLRRGDRERRGGRDRDGAATETGMSSSLRGERREREGRSSNGGGGGPTLERHRSDGMTAERLAASSSGASACRLLPPIVIFAGASRIVPRELRHRHCVMIQGKGLVWRNLDRLANA